jgi:hypothetical protein
MKYCSTCRTVLAGTTNAINQTYQADIIHSSHSFRKFLPTIFLIVENDDAPPLQRGASKSNVRSIYVGRITKTKTKTSDPDPRILATIQPLNVCTSTSSPSNNIKRFPASAARNGNFLHSGEDVQITHSTWFTASMSST